MPKLLAGFMLEGGCECGAIRYRLTREPIFVNCCHCRQCQKLTGSAFALNAIIEAGAVELVEAGEVRMPEPGERRCRSCSTLLWGTLGQFGDGILFLRTGTLDEGERLQPDAHFFLRSKHPWVRIPAGARVFETLPRDGDPPLLGAEAEARIEAARTA